MLPLALLIALGPTKHPIAPTRAELATKYKTFNQAVIRSDAAACVKLMWPDYVYVFSDDTLMRRQEYLSRLFTTVHDLSGPKMWTTVDHVTQDKTGVTVSIRRFLVGVTKNSQDQKAHQFKRIATGTDLWISGAKGWLLKKTNMSKTETFVDGKLGRIRNGVGIGSFQRAR